MTSARLVAPPLLELPVSTEANRSTGTASEALDDEGEKDEGELGVVAAR